MPVGLKRVSKSFGTYKTNFIKDLSQIIRKADKLDYKSREIPISI